MKNISLVLTIAALMACCDKDNYIDSGTHAQKHDCTVWEYFQTDHANWDSLIVMIKHAGMIEYFDATNKDEITIFAPTNHSINQYLKHSMITGNVVTKRLRTFPPTSAVKCFSRT